jgi:hypothetical protein
LVPWQTLLQFRKNSYTSSGGNERKIFLGVPPKLRK